MQTPLGRLEIVGIGGKQEMLQSVEQAAASGDDTGIGEPPITICARRSTLANTATSPKATGSALPSGSACASPPPKSSGASASSSHRHERCIALTAMPACPAYLGA